MNPDKFANQLSNRGVCIWPNFLTQDFSDDMRSDMEEIHSSGIFQRARTGNGAGSAIQGIRQDETHWIERGNQTSAQILLWKKLDDLALLLNRSLFLGITSFEGHYSNYPIGGYYGRHLDSFLDENTRIVSLILYLNKDWKALDGGRLKIYENGSSTEVDPVSGTLVGFMSRELEHEVLLCQAARKSFTGWFKV